MKDKTTNEEAFLFSRLKPTIWSFIVLLLLCGNVQSQTGTSSVTGQVLDPQGQAIPGALVSLTNAKTGAVRTQTTGERGTFFFDLIPPGSYLLETEAQGFKKAVLTDVQALVAKPTEVNVQMEVGNISETITVSASAGGTLINTQDATIGNNFVSEQITQLPLESRNVVQLLSLQPGVTPSGYVAGSRADQANVTLDGVDVNEQQTGLSQLDGAAFASVLRVTPDSVQEFRVTTTNPNAAQGRSSGAQVSLITKSGTNEFHGSLYEFHRNTLTSANDFFNNRSGIPTPKLIRNVFGGSIGGPIKKERAFFFYTYEGRRDSSEVTVVRDVPLPSLGRGEVRFPNDSGGVTTLNINDINALFPAGVNPAAIAALAEAARKYPANDSTVGDGFNTGGFRFNASTPLRWNTHIARMDFTLTEDAKHLLFIRGNYQQDVIGAAPQFPDTVAPEFWNHPSGFVVGHTWSISDNLVNNFRYGLTRLAFSNFGAGENDISFRFVFSPLLRDADGNTVRTLTRATPVHNIADDLSWIRGNHNFQFGTNIRLIRNKRVTFTNAFDSAIANPSFYDFSGAVLSDPIAGIAPGFNSPVQNAVSAVIGRFSQYSANFNFDREGNLLPTGTGIQRTFATQEYDFYIQDSWKVRSNLTLMLGLRYGISRPVYETDGVQVRPTVGLGDFFERRKQSALSGRPLNELITIDLSGPVNDRPGYYDWDKNNFQPRVAFAWTPEFKGGLLGRIFGSNGQSVLRGGFAITNDNIGQQLAVQFDLNSTLGFSSTQTIAANTFNVTDRLAPRFTGFGQDVRSLPMINIPPGLVFPLTTPADEAQRIESSLDDTIITPTNYSWNLSYGRNLPAGFFIEASYIGRAARNLLATRDVMALNNIVEPRSGIDWYTAAGMLHDLRASDTPVQRVPRIAYFENLFGRNLGANLAAAFEDPTFLDFTATQSVFYLVAREGYNILDWTFVQVLLDDLSVVAPNLFFHPQYAALSTFSTVASSDYHAGTLSIRQRYKNSIYFDFNYTLSKSIDDASGLQTSDTFGAAFILNPLRPEDSRAVSDFDIRHIINANGLWHLPVGKGRMFLKNLSGFADAFLGGWQLSGIFRWNSGLPARSPFDAAQWATNWNVQSNGVRIAPIESSPTRGGAAAPNLFSDPVAAYRNFRNARPGETGDRNVLRLPGFVSLDMGLSKSFTMPWNELHKLQFRWEVFNVTNTQRLTITPEGITRETFGLDIDSQLGTPPPVFGNLNAIQGTPRVMQFGLRYSF
ncbi:MAG TPA: TonB-dependent receptor [Blastocatellia bacterium]|nr:TonB-dependent receptor [Blastocatellia bacterium]